MFSRKFIHSMLGDKFTSDLRGIVLGSEVVWGTPNRWMYSIEWGDNVGKKRALSTNISAVR